MDLENFHIDQQMMDAVGRLGGRLYTATNEQFERKTPTVAQWKSRPRN